MAQDLINGIALLKQLALIKSFNKNIVSLSLLGYLRAKTAFVDIFGV